MRNDNNIEYFEIKKFFKKTLGENVNKKTVFFKDFELVGQDAELLILKFSETFNVDISDFKFNDYFVDEYFIPFQYWYDKFFKKEKHKRKEFDIVHLQKIIDTGKWIDV